MINPDNLPSIEQIELWRKSNGLTREDLSEMCGVSFSAYEKWCSKKSPNTIPADRQAIIYKKMNPDAGSLPPGYSEIFTTDEELNLADRASRLVKADSLAEFCRDAIQAEARRVIAANQTEGKAAS